MFSDARRRRRWRAACIVAYDAGVVVLFLHRANGAFGRTVTTAYSLRETSLSERSLAFFLLGGGDCLMEGLAGETIVW